MASKNVMVCFGTRPELIKLGPVLHELEQCPEFQAVPVTTAQHREMLDQTLEAFQIVPAADLRLMRPRQTLPYLTAAIIESVSDLLDHFRPDVLLVQGDTTTTMGASLAAFYAGVPVGHVEAGLRTYDRRSPFPEEINRRLVSIVASWHFAPTVGAADNLRRENVPESSIYVTGNTVVDALQWMVRRLSETPDRNANLPVQRRPKRVLVTMHRRESQGEVQRDIYRCVADVCRNRSDVEIVFPVHLSPAVREPASSELAGLKNVHLIDPVGYQDFIRLMRTAYVIVTDSGGIQEEAPALDVPVLVSRDATERPEVIEAGCARLCGTDPQLIRKELERLLDDPDERAAMTSVPNPYGDGRAAARIVAHLANRTDESTPFRDGGRSITSTRWPEKRADPPAVSARSYLTPRISP